jgi:CheY-like chemotaxis protein
MQVFIALARLPPEKNMEDQKRILLVSRDVMVLQTRKLMLGAYFDVRAAARVLEAKTFLTEESFDLIVLCYTLTDDDCQKVIEAARLHSPHAKVLMLTVTRHTAIKLNLEHYDLPAEQGPFTLVKKSAELLGFEFRTKGRMVRTVPPPLLAAAPNAT